MDTSLPPVPDRNSDLPSPGQWITIKSVRPPKPIKCTEHGNTLAINLSRYSSIPLGLPMLVRGVEIPFLCCFHISHRGGEAGLSGPIIVDTREVQWMPLSEPYVAAFLPGVAKPRQLPQQLNLPFFQGDDPDLNDLIPPPLSSEPQ